MEKPDMVNQPPHYLHGMECIDEMVLIFGKTKTAYFCLLNAWKYRKRAPFKGSSIEDSEKSDWYIAKYKELIKGNENDEWLLERRKELIEFKKEIDEFLKNRSSMVSSNV